MLITGIPQDIEYAENVNTNSIDYFYSDLK